MDIKEMKLYLKDKYDDIIKILTHFRCHNFKTSNNTILCKKPGGDGYSISIKLDNNLTSSAFSLGYSGDLFGMLSYLSNVALSEIFNVCKNIIDKKHIEESVTLFDGFLDNTYIPQKLDDTIYSDEELIHYEKTWNMRFAKDYIPPKIQNKFEIGYDNFTNRITIPYRNEFGELVGVMGRANFETDLRYYPLLKFSKSHFLYGLYNSKNKILETKTAYIGESEKFTMQLHSYGYTNSVSIGNANISVRQVELLFKHGCRNFILCFDEGLDISIIKKNIETIRDVAFMRDDYKIGVLIDRKNEYLKEGTKNSPSDLGKETWLKLVNNCVKFLSC